MFQLTLNQAQITVEGHAQGSLTSAALQSPPTFSKPVSVPLLEEALALFGYNHADLDERITPAHINAGAGHLLLALNSRERLKAMRYEQQTGHDLMVREGWATILLVWAETDQLFHTRNPFAFGGVYEDPATGAATAALGGYLRDIGWPHGGLIDIIQGEDMGSPSRLRAEIPQQPGSSIRCRGWRAGCNTDQVLSLLPPIATPTSITATIMNASSRLLTWAMKPIAAGPIRIPA